MSDELERNLERLIRKGYDVEEPGERIRRDLLPRMFAWQNELLSKKAVETAGGPARPRRESRRWVRGRSPSRMSLLPALRAAGLVVGIILLAVLTTSSPTATRPGKNPTALRKEPNESPAAERAPQESRPPRETLDRSGDALDPKPAPERLEPPRPSEEKPRPQPAPPQEPKESPKPRPAPDPSVPPGPARPPESAVAIARLESARGEVYLVSGTTRTPAQGGAECVGGQGLETSGPDSQAVLKYGDGTRVEIGPEAKVRALKEEGGKRIVLDRGTLAAEVVRQPAGRPMVVVTPQAEARVVGTTLRVTVEAVSTRLEVTEGRVQLKRLSDGKMVDVPSGYYAVSAVGVDLAARPTVPDTPTAAALATAGRVVIKFGVRVPGLPEGILLDSGEEYDRKRGYGWKGPVKNHPTAVFEGNPVKGRHPEGPFPEAKDPMTASHMAAGWKDLKETWVMPVANGRYLVTLCVGDLGNYAQGPHHVWIEGKQVLNAVVTKAGILAEKKDVPVEVTDGELTMVVGGSGQDLDGTSDTVLNYLIVKRTAR